MSDVKARLFTCGVMVVMWFAFAAMCLAHDTPRSQARYRQALTQAQARTAESVFNRTGRMDHQTVRYFADPFPSRRSQAQSWSD